MGSSSSEEVVTNTSQNIGIDRRAVLQNGQQIVDSIVENNSPEVVEAALRPALAAWLQQVRSGHLNLVETVSLADSVIDMVNKSQIQMSESAFDLLKAGRDQYRALLDNNALTVELVEGVSDNAFETTNNAIDLVAEVKTADFANLSKTIMLFALVALGISSWTIRGK